MDILITGCECSGTTALCEAMGGQGEYKPLVASWKYYQELMRWKAWEEHGPQAIETCRKYLEDWPVWLPFNNVVKCSLNNEVSLDFLKFCKLVYPDLKIVYLVRDGRDVAHNINLKVWGGSQGLKYTRTLHDGANQWKLVIRQTWAWAMENAYIVKYEELAEEKEIFGQVITKQFNPLVHSKDPAIQYMLKRELEITRYLTTEGGSE